MRGLLFTPSYLYLFRANPVGTQPPIAVTQVPFVNDVVTVPAYGHPNNPDSVWFLVTVSPNVVGIQVMGPSMTPRTIVESEFITTGATLCVHPENDKVLYVGTADLSYIIIDNGDAAADVYTFANPHYAANEKLTELANTKVRTCAWVPLSNGESALVVGAMTGVYV